MTKWLNKKDAQPENPYRFLGPLDPVKDKLVLVYRDEELNRVIRGIVNGDYWSISGPRQIGKTTFLRQIQYALPDVYYINLDLKVFIAEEKKFYPWLRDQVLNKIPAKHKSTYTNDWDDENPGFSFFCFLEKFKAEDNDKMIVFFFDEIDDLPFLRNFLHIWRKVFQDRFNTKELKKYAVVITGSADLIKLSMGRTSPFNIAKKMILKDFPDEDSERLIDIPFEKLNVGIEQEAKKEIISQIAGHPQMLQQTCHNLVNIALKERRNITIRDVEDTLESLFTNNTTITMLRNNLEKNKKLELLIKKILAGKKKKYFPYQDFSTWGTGPIIEENTFCAIRNEVFERFFMDFLNIEINDSRFKELKEVGEGGMGVVYQARDTELDRIVAIKKIRSRFARDKNAVMKLVKEARITAKLDHPNIVRVYDIRMINRTYHIIMEFIEGDSYGDILKWREEGLELGEVLEVGQKLFSALDFSHKQGIIHRDIKPNNIMRDRRNEIKIVDFGLAIINEAYDESSRPGYIIGTPHYLSPEQINFEQLDYRTDIYSAGITLFELLTGRVPYDGKEKEIIWKHQYDNIPLVNSYRTEVPAELSTIIEKCMQKKRRMRFQSAEEVLEQIESLIRKLKAPTLKENGYT